MSSSMRVVRQVLEGRGRAVLAAVVLVAAFAGPVAGANAAGNTVALTLGPGPAPGSTVAVRAIGSVAGDTVLHAYLERDGVDCATNVGDHRFRPGAVQIGVDPANPDPSATLASGAYDVVLRWAPLPAGSYRVCVYLYGSSQMNDEAPLALATAALTLVEDNDLDGVPDNTDACPDDAGTGPDGCPPVPVIPVTPTQPVTLPAPKLPVPVAAPAPTISDPTGVMKLKVSKGKATSCGAGCVVRTRTVGPFSFALKVKVSAAKTTAAGSVTLTKTSAQAGKAGKLCLARFVPAFKQKCQTVTWKVGKKLTVSGSMTTPATIKKFARPGFSMTAQVGGIGLGGGDAIYLKSAGGRTTPDTNESACAASVHAHAAC